MVYIRSGHKAHCRARMQDGSCPTVHAEWGGNQRLHAQFAGHLESLYTCIYGCKVTNHKEVRHVCADSVSLCYRTMRRMDVFHKKKFQNSLAHTSTGIAGTATQDSERLNTKQRQPLVVPSHVHACTACLPETHAHREKMKKRKDLHSPAPDTHLVEPQKSSRHEPPGIKPTKTEDRQEQRERERSIRLCKPESAPSFE